MTTNAAPAANLCISRLGVPVGSLQAGILTANPIRYANSGVIGMTISLSAPTMRELYLSQGAIL